MRKLFVVFSFFLPFCLSAQHFEAGILLGTAYYEGDLTGSSIGDRLSEVNPGGGGFLRYNINNYFAARLSVNYGRLSGNDVESRENRNLRFKSGIWEFGLTGEINILGYQPYNLERVFSPYLFGGVVLFKFNPYTDLDGQNYFLQPLRTEGQGLPEFPERLPYNLTQFAIPLGAGLKYAINDTWNVGIEGGLRVTFTDYLDDVSLTYPGSSVLLETYGEASALLSDRSVAGREAGSPRGNPGVNDYYFFGGVTISYNFLDNGLVGSRGKSRRGTGCPTF